MFTVLETTVLGQDQEAKDFSKYRSIFFILFVQLMLDPLVTDLDHHQLTSSHDFSSSLCSSVCLSTPFPLHKAYSIIG